MTLGNGLWDKIALVTGAASGIGQAIAYRFAMEGAKVAVIDVNSEGGQETVERILTNSGVAMFLKADVSKSQQVQEAIKATVAEYGGLDILVSNAAIEFVGTIEQTSEEDWQHVVSNNLESVFLCSKFVIPYMKKQGRGVIVNIGSINGLLGVSEHAAYNAAKGGVISLTRQLAVDYGPFGIRVNCICPCTTDTPMVRRSLVKKNLDPDQCLQEWGKHYPLRRVGKPEDIANAVLFLASDEASWITGVILPVDGGNSCR